MELAAREGVHHAILRVLLHPSMQERDTQVREDVLREMIGHLGGGAQVDLLGLLHQRVDDVRLAALLHLLADEVVDLLAPRLRLGDGLDRKSARRHLAHDRHIEIAVGRECERPRDRRRGHHQHVGMLPLRSQRRALQDAEAMLLVDDDKSKLPEADRILDQRMRADDHVERAAGELRLHLAALLCGRRPGEDRDAKARRLEQAPDVDEVLLGENLGRRHEGDLETVLHRDDRRHQRHDRLAGSDVALQQPVHRLRTLHVLDDLGDDLLLVAGQLEREDAPRGVTDRVGDHDRPRFAIGFGGALPQHQPKLEQKELFEDQPALRRRAEAVQRFDRRAFRRKVDVVDRGAPVDQLLPHAHVFRQRIRQRRRQLRQGLVHQRPLHLGGQRSGLFVDRHDPPGVQRLLRCGGGFVRFFPLDDLVLRARELKAVRREFELPEQDDALMRMEDVVEEGLIEPDGAERPGVVAHDHLEDLEARPARRPDAAAKHFAGDRCRHAWLQ